MRVEFTVMGPPAGKQRHRMGNGRTYTPEKTVNYEVLTKLSCQRQCGLVSFENRPIRQVIRAYMPIPSSVSKRKAELMRAGKILPTIKPDYDNIEKIISDACQGTLFHDDKQICSATIEKYYSDIPRVEVAYEDLYDV